MGTYRGLTVVSTDNPDAVHLLLEPDEHPEPSLRSERTFPPSRRRNRATRFRRSCGHGARYDLLLTAISDKVDRADAAWPLLMSLLKVTGAGRQGSCEYLRQAERAGRVTGLGRWTGCEPPGISARPAAIGRP
jgi:hypothetical protein